MRDDKRVQSQGRTRQPDRCCAAELRGASEPTEPRIALARIMDRGARGAARATRFDGGCGVLAGAVACLIAVFAAMWTPRVPRLPQTARQIARAPAGAASGHGAELSCAAGRCAVQVAAIRRAPPHPSDSGGQGSNDPLPKLAVFPDTSPAHARGTGAGRVRAPWTPRRAACRPGRSEALG